MATELVKVEPANAVAVRDPESILRFAVEKGASVETIERMMNVRRELRAEQAKEAFDHALAAFQSECPVIEKRKAVLNKDGRSIRYHYAPLDDIVQQVKALLQKHGFSYRLTTEAADKAVKAICTVTHSLGHSQDSAFQVPIDPQAFMNEQQKFASALTFAKRYAFCNALGILTGDEDVDGQTEKQKPAGPSALHGDKAPTHDDRANKQKLVDLLRSVAGCKGYALDDGAKGRIEQWLIDEMMIGDAEHLADLNGQKLADVVKKVEAKLQGKQ